MKEPSTKQKDNLLNGKKIFVNDMSEEGLISKMYKYFISSTLKKKQLNKKGKRSK